MKQLIGEMERNEGAECLVFCDILSCIAVAEDPKFHGRTKHICLG